MNNVRGCPMRSTSSGRCRSIAAAITALSLAACSAPSLPSSPSDLALPSASRGGSTVPEPSTGIARIAIDGLEVGPRSDGSDDGARIQPAELSAGELVWVIDVSQRPEETWLLVAADRGVDEFAIPFGWIPEDLDGDPTLEPVVIDCPEPPLGVPQ